MENLKAYQFAIESSSKELGLDINKIINDKFDSSATGQLKFVIGIINSVSYLFERQKLAFEHKQDNWLLEFHNFVIEAVEGDGNKHIGAKKSIEQYFCNQEFKRNPEKKRAIILLLKNYLNYIEKEITALTEEEIKNLQIENSESKKYFSKNYIFGELIKTVELQLK